MLPCPLTGTLPKTPATLLMTTSPTAMPPAPDLDQLQAVGNPARGSTAIDIAGLHKRFASKRGPVDAVRDVNLTIEPGELFFLLGPSGCGKTTLLRMIAGFIDPTGGNITFARAGKTTDVTHLAPNKRNTGMVFQSYALWPHMTVAQNVAFGLSVRKITGKERDNRVADALAAVQLEQYAARKPNELSGGQQQRVALARALVIRPDVLLLDEPLSNLDAKLRIELRSQIRSICKASGITSIYVTHDQKEALSMADRIAIMRDGQVVQVGRPQELYRAPGSTFVAEFLGETNLLPATVTEAGELPEVEIAGMRVRARATGARALAVGAAVTCSIRPEALSVVDAAGPRLADADGLAGGLAAGSGGVPSVLRGTRLSTTFLGDVAHHEVSVGPHRVQVAEINPPLAHLTNADDGPQVSLRVRADDVVVLSD